MAEAPPKRPLLTLYSRTYCHLCDDMIAALRLLQAKMPFDVEIVDVDADPGLEEKYGQFVPVLESPEGELCHYSLDASKVNEYLGKIR